MARKVAESHSVAYFNDPKTLKEFGLEEAGYYIVTDDVSEKTEHVNSDGEKYSASHETNPTLVRRVFPAPDGGEGFVYGDDDEDGDD